jgi:hypothetical protein
MCDARRARDGGSAQPTVDDAEHVQTRGGRLFAAVRVALHGEACGPAHAAYDLRMQKARVTVTVRREVLSKAERQVRRGRAKSVSAWVDAAMEEKARREDLTALLSEMKAENGPPSAKEEAWARAVLGL